MREQVAQRVTRCEISESLVDLLDDVQRPFGEWIATCLLELELSENLNAARCGQHAANGVRRRLGRGNDRLLQIINFGGGVDLSDLHSAQQMVARRLGM